MLKVAQINITLGGSTGRLMKEIHYSIQEKNMKCISFYGRGKKSDNPSFIKFGTEISFLFHVLYTFIFNKQGHFAKIQTRKLLKYLDEYKPDVIHLHNIQGYYLNYPMLFEWLSKYEGKVIWTLHDCWAFTGHCCYFTAVGCAKWKTHCGKCIQKHAFPFSWFFDTSSSEFDLKKKLFTSVRNLKITTPSIWLSKLVKQSFFKKYPVHVVNNWVDLDVFKPVQIKRKDKKIVLGVANYWEERKGLKVFVELSKKLDSSYQLVMIGLNKKQINGLPSNIIGIERTTNVHELVEYYSKAYVLLNPSIEETFSLVTLEALACNTPVIVQNTSAVHEMVAQDCGIIMQDFNMENYLKAIDSIQSICRENNHIRNSVLKYNKNDKIQMYMDLYIK